MHPPGSTVPAVGTSPGTRRCSASRSGVTRSTGISSVATKSPTACPTARSPTAEVSGSACAGRTRPQVSSPPKSAHGVPARFPTHVHVTSPLTLRRRARRRGPCAPRTRAASARPGRRRHRAAVRRPRRSRWSRTIWAHGATVIHASRSAVVATGRSDERRPPYRRPFSTVTFGIELRAHVRELGDARDAQRLGRPASACRSNRRRRRARGRGSRAHRRPSRSRRSTAAIRPRAGERGSGITRARRSGSSRCRASGMSSGQQRAELVLGRVRRDRRRAWRAARSRPRRGCARGERCRTTVRGAARRDRRATRASVSGDA